MSKTWLGIALIAGLWACGSVNQDLGDNGTQDELQRQKPDAPSANGNGNANGDGGGPSAASGTMADAGTFDPFVLDTSKAVLSHQELFDYLKPKTAADGTLLGTFQIAARERVCPGQCEVWKASSPAALSDGYSSVALPTNGNIYVVPTSTPALGFSFNLFLNAAIPGVTGGYLFIGLSDAGTSDSGASVGAPPQLRSIGTRAFSPKTVLTQSTTRGMSFGNGTPELNLSLGNTHAVQFSGRIYNDGTVHMVTIVGQGGTGMGTHQLAIFGKLSGL